MRGFGRKIKFATFITVWIVVLFTKIVNTGRETRNFREVERINEKKCIE